MVIPPSVLGVLIVTAAFVNSQAARAARQNRAIPVQRGLVEEAFPNIEAPDVLEAARARGRKGGRKSALTKPRVRLAQSLFAARSLSSRFCPRGSVEIRLSSRPWMRSVR